LSLHLSLGPAAVAASPRTSDEHPDPDRSGRLLQEQRQIRSTVRVRALTELIFSWAQPVFKGLFR
jgi:hypothetical protein